jgi:hypothetical protein
MLEEQQGWLAWPQAKHLFPTQLAVSGWAAHVGGVKLSVQQISPTRPHSTQMPFSQSA